MASVEPDRNVYIGHRYVPKLFGEWDNSNEYEGLSIVTHKGASYTSKKRTPVGIDIENEEFWVITGNYDAQVQNYREETQRVSEALETKASKETLNQFQDTINTEMSDFKTETDNTITQFKSDINDNINQFKTGINTEMSDFKEQLDVTPVKSVLKSESVKRDTSMNPTIVAYGDSNTRFYHSGGTGSISYAYSSVIEKNLLKYPNFYGSKIINKGFPSMEIEWALSNYKTHVSNNNPDIVIIGFGTNNIKKNEYNMSDYMNNMENLIDRMLGDDITPIVLGIPWFDDDYGDQNQDRLPEWNTALHELCISKDVEFVDIYNMFTSKNSDTWFNDNPKRHLSVYAQRVLGEELSNRIINLNSVSTYKSEFIQNTFDFSKIEWFTRHSFDLNFRTFSLGTYSIDTIELKEGQSLTFNAQGRFVVGFYPRDNAVINVDPAGTLELSDTKDDNVYYPIRYIGDSSTMINAHVKDETEVNVSVESGTAYLSFIASEFIPRNTTRIQPRDPIQLNGNNMPSNPENGDRVMVIDLTKEVRWTDISGGTWADHSGYRAVGTTEQRTGGFLQNQVAKGFKYYDTTENKRYRLDGNGEWVES